jgi:glucuronoarabinoxylan endo-1,4-beta-xylanase
MSTMRTREILCLAVLIQATISGFAQSTATVDWTNVHQVIDGFGASDTGTSYGTQLSSAQQSFFFGTDSGQLGLSILRVGVPNNAETIGSCASVGASCAGASWVISDMQAIVANGGRVYASPWSPPAPYTVGDTTVCQSGNSALATGHYGDYANWFLNFVKSVAGQGVPLYALSIQNEPDQCTAYDSSEWSSSAIDSFITNNLGPTFSSNGISTLIFAPEGSNYSVATSLGAICGTDATCSNYLGGYNWHEYQASTSGFTVAPNPVPSGWASGKKWWETEASCGIGYGPGFCESGFNTDMTDALHWGSVVDQRMQDGANAWLYWLLIYYDGAATPDDESLIGNASSSFAIAKRAYMLGQYAKFVRPGYYRIDATRLPQSGVSVSAFQNTPTNTLVIIATNYTGSAVSQTFNITNAPTFSTMTPTITSPSQQMATLSNVSVSSGSFTYTLPAQSIITFVGSATSVAPPTNLSGTVVQ